MKKAGIIGCGGISQVHCAVLAGMDDVELAAVCDVTEEKAVKLRELYLGQNDNKKADAAGRIRICTDWHEICGMDLDVVHICTPHYLHVPMAVELLDAGKAVFMEKPCAISQEQFDELKAADERHPGMLGICFQNRYNETTRMIDDGVSEGKIGKITGGRAFVTWRRDEDYYSGSPWKGRIATEGGGALINQSIHTLDLLLRYLGEPETVKATVSNHHLGAIPAFGERPVTECPVTSDRQAVKPDEPAVKPDIEDTVEAWMEFADGARACFYASTGYITDAPVILEIQGDKGRISMNGSAVILENEEGMQILQTANRPGYVKDYWGRGHKACIEDFYISLETGEKFPVDLGSVENSFNTMMRIYGFRS
ncbi:MAG: Gfo/Idh/MocA family oxidoreductase [Lachnospiraceae bacterium]|nr:Gfo/Idh/MocA family oxidoreductase [Lachnospiraceae bacterium]